MNDQNPIEWAAKKVLEFSPEKAIKSVPGYRGVYKYFSLGDMTASYELERGSEKRRDPEARFANAAEKTGVVASASSVDKGAIEILFAGSPNPVEAALLSGDVLPGLWPGQRLTIRLFLFADYISLGNKEKARQPALVPVGRGVSPYGGEDRQLTKYLISSSAKSFVPEKIADDASVRIPHFVLKTSFGDLDVFGWPNDHCDVWRAAPGTTLAFAGVLAADVAVGEYANGAVYNVENDLIILRDAFANLNFSRCPSIFSEDCVYIVNEEVRAKGPEAILSNFESVASMARDKGLSYAVKFGALTIEDIAKAGDFRRGQKCLLFIMPDNSLLNAIFAWTDAEGKIRKLESVYYFKEEMGVYVSDDIADWLRGRPDYDQTPEHDDE